MWLWISLWWLSGIVSMLMLPTDRALTWGGLVGSIVSGFVGPIVWIVIAIVMLVRAEFWRKPIFRQKSKRGRA